MDCTIPTCAVNAEWQMPDGRYVCDEHLDYLANIFGEMSGYRPYSNGTEMTFIAIYPGNRA